MDFPAGTSVGSALVVEAVGIGPGTLSASTGEVLTYTVTNAVNVPALTNIRIQISNINNPPTPSGSFTVSITTRNAANAIIDGPTATSAYNMVQVGNAQIAPGAVTTTKIATGAVSPTDVAQTFVKQLLILDNPAGNAIGWNPDGVTTDFDIDPAPGVTGSVDNFVAIMGTFDPANCDVPWDFTLFETFDLFCRVPPSDGASLKYISIHTPTEIAS
jgi:hypothetical protein